MTLLALTVNGMENDDGPTIVHGSAEMKDRNGYTTVQGATMGVVGSLFFDGYGHRLGFLLLSAGLSTRLATGEDAQSESPDCSSRTR